MARWCNKTLTLQYQISWFASPNYGFIAMCLTLSILTIGLLGAFKNKNYFMLCLSLGVVPILFYTLIKIVFYNWFLFLFSLVQSIFVGMSLNVIFEYYSGGTPSLKLLKYTLCFIFVFVYLNINYKFIKNHGQQLSNITPYQTIGEYLKDNTPPNASVGYVEVGQIGYYSQRKIIDMTGMVTKGVVAHLKLRDFDWTLNEYKPDYVIDYLPFGELFDFAKSKIRPNYKIIHTFNFGTGYLAYLYQKYR